MDNRRIQELKTLLLKLGLTEHDAIDWDVLNRALTHVSVSPTDNYEKLEFLGDAVVRLLASEVLMQDYPDAKVGDFANIRSMLVSDRVLAKIASSYGVENYLSINASGLGNKAAKVARNADALEAILGALYISGRYSLKLIRPWLNPILSDWAATIRQDPEFINYKDSLQEWTQAQYQTLPTYEVSPNSRTPTPEQERFFAVVSLNGEVLGEGYGSSKKAAEQSAARVAVEKLTPDLSKDRGLNNL
jgi:ribonuclease-3